MLSLLDSVDGHGPIDPSAAVPEAWRRPGLYPTLWPADHGDVERTQCSVGGGLPADVTADRIKTLRNPALYHPNFLYTRNPDELFVYGRGEMVGKPNYFARVDATTLEVRERAALPFTPYVGGALVHSNGDVFLAHGTRLTRYRGGSLADAQALKLPLINGLMTVYNGLTVASDGKLLIKGFAVTFDDVPLIPKRQKRLVAIGAMLALGGALLGSLRPDLWLAALALVFTVPALAALVLTLTRTSLRAFMGKAQPGIMMIIDPDTLEIISRTTPPQRLSFGRLSIAHATGTKAGPDWHTQPATTEWVLATGDTRVYRFAYADGALVEDKPWTEVYRKRSDGSTVACAPCALGDGVFFTDNVVPGKLSRKGFRLFRKDMRQTQSLKSVDVSKGAPGFNFWTVALDTHSDNVIAWESVTGALCAYRSGDLAEIWRGKARCTDCLTLAGDRGHLYAADYDGELEFQQYKRIFDVSPPGQDFQKSLLVIDLETGVERLRVGLGTSAPTMSVIMPGMNDDVFVATRDALVRVYA